MGRTKVRRAATQRRKQTRRQRRKQKRTEGARPAIRGPVMPKLSAVLWDFAMPILEPLTERDLVDVTARVQLATLAWNACLMDEGSGGTDCWDTVRQEIARLPGFDVELALPLLDTLRNRKQESFADDRRFVLDFQVSEPSSSDFHLVAISAELRP